VKKLSGTGVAPFSSGSSAVQFKPGNWKDEDSEDYISYALKNLQNKNMHIRILTYFTSRDIFTI